MDYDYNNKNHENDGKKKILTILIIAFAVLLVLNVVMFTLLSTNVKKLIDQETNNLSDTLNDRIDTAIAGRLTSSISEEVTQNIADDVVESATAAMQNIIAQEIIENYKREYNLPENYSGIGVIVAAKVGSVLELEASAVSNSNRTVASQSSAFILSADGYAFTNAHCVTFEDNILQGFWIVGTETKEYTTIKANFKGSQTKYDMEIVSYDVDKDLAIIKFKNPPANLNPVTFADSDLMNLGEEVAAIGNAQGLGTSLTTGVVSNTSQPYNNVRIIQTDTTINPGNSGGPLFNIYGEVIGVVSFKIIQSNANEGLGFAIASNSVKEYINSIETQKGIEIPYLTT